MRGGIMTGLDDTGKEHPLATDGLGQLKLAGTSSGGGSAVPWYALLRELRAIRVGLEMLNELEQGELLTLVDNEE